MTKSEKLLVGLTPDQKIVLKDGHIAIHAYGGDEDVPYEDRDYVVETLGGMMVLAHAGAVAVIKHHDVRNWVISE